MKVLVSGEGPTDIGLSSLAGTFEPGPMMLFVDKLLEPILDYSVLDPQFLAADSVQFIHKTELGRHRDQRPTRLPGIRREAGTAYHFESASALGRLAKQQLDRGPVIAVLFRDSDGTNSTSGQDWRRKLESIQSGFEAAEFAFGVPMLPRPKSEAWLLCAVARKHNNCASLENESGNDASPNSLKSQLAAHFEGEVNRHSLCDSIATGLIDPVRIQMPSFAAFRNTLEQKAQESIAAAERGL